MTPEGIAKLKTHEGLRLKAYTDTVGKTTIGWGRNLDDVGIAYDEAQLLFDDDVVRAHALAAFHFPWFAKLDPVRQDAIINLVFNMGIDGVKGFKRMITAIEREDWDTAAWELSNSKWKTQVGKERHDDLMRAIELGKWD